MSVKIVKRHIQQTNTNTTDGVFERGAQNSDEFGHTLRNKYIRKSPEKSRERMKPSVELTGNFSKDQKPLPSPVSAPCDMSGAYDLCDQLANGREDHRF
jgi:hypothetical protein